MNEPATQPMRVLFLCTHNSSRSQMAEGLLRARGGAAFDVFSAGTEPRVVHPLAIKAMREIGIDISDHWVKSLEEFRGQPPMDLVVTVCNEAAEACPYFSNARQQVHWGFPIPVVLREVKKSAWPLFGTFAISLPLASDNSSNFNKRIPRRAG